MTNSEPELQSLSDEELARQSQGGSLPAFEELVYRYEARVYSFLVQLCASSLDARELTQDTFVRAFQAIARFDSRRAFASWLFTIARNKCIDLHRAAPPAASAAASELPDNDDPAVLLVRREERQNLWELARQHLPTAQFQALWLRYAEDMNIAQIAQVLRKTRTHTKVLLFRARQSLGAKLEAAGLGTRLPDVSLPPSTANARRARALADSATEPLKTPGPSPA